MEFEKIIPRRITRADWDTIVSTACGNYVEVGTHHGASATAASINADRVTTIDILDWQPKVYETIYPEAAKKITFFKGTSTDYAQQLDGQEPSIDVLFIDGAHEYEYVIMDCKMLIPHVKKGGFVLFHDYNPNNSVTRVYQAVNKYLSTIKYEKQPEIPGSGNLLKIRIL